jgi:sec-independent protein translocase protein TatA
MPNLRGTEWLIIILLVVLLFGAKRLPDAARSVGRSLRIFKAETKGLVEGEAEPDASGRQSAQAGNGELPGSAPAAGSSGADEQPAPQAESQPPQQA